MLHTVGMIRLGTSADLAAASSVYRRASLSNAGDRDNLLAHPEYLILGPEGLAEGRTHPLFRSCLRSCKRGRASPLLYHCCTKFDGYLSVRAIRVGSGGKGGVGSGGSGVGTGGTGEGAGSGPGGVGVGAGGTGSGGIGAGGVGSGTGGVIMARSLPLAASNTPHIWLRGLFAVARPVTRLTAPEAVGQQSV